MATNFPSSLDSFTNPTAVDTLDSPPHDTQHADANDAIEALQAKVGVDGSAVTTSLDYQLNTGYRYHSTVYFTSSGTFTKASYPWLRAVRVKCQGAGGGGGGTDQCNVGEAAAAPGGGGGSYAESFITDISWLAASVTVTVGAGGAGGVGGDSTNPTASSASEGGESSFGSGTAYEVSAGGGDLGAPGRDGLNVSGQVGASPRRTGTGDINLGGSGSQHSWSVGTTDAALTMANGTHGGDSVLGAGGEGKRRRNQNGSLAGSDGKNYGSGGGGAATTAQSTLTDGSDGGDGADGIVIVELYA